MTAPLLDALEAALKAERDALGGQDVAAEAGLQPVLEGDQSFDVGFFHGGFRGGRRSRSDIEARRGPQGPARRRSRSLPEGRRGGRTAT